MRKWSKAPRILSLLAVMIAAAVGFAPAAYAEMGDVRIDGAETPAAQTKAVAAVAKPDGTVEFSTLAEAIENADGATVRLLADVTESVAIAKGKTITLDLSGHTLTAPGDKKAIVVDGGTLSMVDSTAKGAPAVSDDYKKVTYESGKVVAKNISVGVINGGSFTLSSGTIVSSGDCGVYVGAKGGGKGTFTMNGGYIEAQEFGVGAINEGTRVEIAGGVVVAKDNAALAGNGSAEQGGTVMTVSGGTLVSHIKSSGYIACGVYHPQNGVLNIVGGTIYADGGVGILARAGSANITGGTIIATGSASGWVGDRKFDVPSSGIVVDRAAEYPGALSDDVVNISGDAVIKADEGQSALQVVVKADTSKDGLVVVTGGSFSTPVEDEFLGDGFKPTKQPDGSFGVHKHTLVAVAEVPATCDANGSKAHWKCKDCGALYRDKDMKEEVTDPASLVSPKLGHKAVHVPAKAATIDAEGIVEHWYCAQCDTYFADAKLTETMTKAETVVAKLPKEFTVTFESGAGKPTAVTVKDGALLDEPTAPTLKGWKFLGWFKVKNADGTVAEKWDFTKDAVMADITLYGGWVKADEGKSEAKPTNKLPKTGDASMLPMMVAGITGAAALVVATKLRKR